MLFMKELECMIEAQHTTEAVDQGYCDTTAHALSKNVQGFGCCPDATSPGCARAKPVHRALADFGPAELPAGLSATLVTYPLDNGSTRSSMDGPFSSSIAP